MPGPAIICEICHRLRIIDRAIFCRAQCRRYAGHPSNPLYREAVLRSSSQITSKARFCSPRVCSLPRTMMRPLVKVISSRICVCRSQPALVTAGKMNLEQMSRSERSFLFMALLVVIIGWEQMILLYMLTISLH